MTHTGNVQPKECIIGHDLYEQTFTVTGGPSGGTMQFHILDEVTDPVSITANAATIQTAIRALSYPCASSATVTTGTSTVVVTSGANGGFIEPIRVSYSLTGGTNPEIVRTITGQRPNLYEIADPGVYGEASVPPTVGRQAIPGTVADRASQSKASEWFGRSWLPGLGRLHYRESESVERFWDSNCWTHVDRQITLPALVERETLAGSAGSPFGVTAYSVGVTANGVRIVAMFDTNGLTTAGTPVYYDSSTQTWQIIPAAATLAHDSSITDIIFYGGYCYMGYTKSAAHGYWSWDGGSASNATVITTTDTSQVLAWEEWDGKLFRLLANGKLQWATVSSGAVAESDWLPTANTPTYKGPGYAYALKVFTDRTGAEVLHIIATDGLYTFDFDNWRIKRVKRLNGPALLAPGVYPQPNSVTEWNGDLYFIQGDTVLKYDGSVISNIGPATDDGLPDNGIAFFSAIRPRALHATNTMLLCAMSKQVENVPSTTIAATTTVSVFTTYYTSLTLTGGAGTNDTVWTDDVQIVEATDTLGAVLGFNGQGWHSIVPLTTSSTSAPFTSRAVLYHELHNIPRLIFAPGKYIRWRDKSSNPINWADMKWDNSASRWFVTSYFDLDLSDIPKVLYFMRLGYHDTGSGSTIIPYWQINGVLDDPNAVVGVDPAAHLAPLYDRSGTAVTIGDGNDPAAGVIRMFYERETVPNTHSRGEIAYEARLAFKLTSTDSARTPYIDFFSSPLNAKFPALSSYTVAIKIADGGSDGRSARRQYNDLKASYLARQLLSASFQPEEWVNVSIDFFNGKGFSSGDFLADNGPAMVTFTLSEQVRQ